MRKFVIFSLLIVAMIVAMLFYGGNDFKAKDAMPILDENGSSSYELKDATNVEKAVGEAIKEHGKTYGKGECITEGHIILGAEQKGNEVKAYTIASVGVFEFQDGIFAIVSGSGAIPTVMTFSIDEHGQYKLIAYEEPLDGDAYARSVKRMFPKKYYSQVLYAEKYYDELAKQQERQAREYLKQIGRDAKVSTSYVEKQPLNISKAWKDMKNRKNSCVACRVLKRGFV